MSSIEMKNSGIEWIGLIPNNWQTKRIKDLSIISTGQTPPREDIKCFSEEKNNNYLWIKPEDLNSFCEIHETKEYISQYGLNFIKLYSPTSVIVSGIGAGLGNIGISKNKFTTNQQNHVISKHKNFKYLFYFMFAAKEYVKSLSVGNVLPILNATKLKNVLILNPPLSQQTAIANYLDHHTTKIDKEISLLEQKVEKLDEYKQALIYETVTKGLDKNVSMKDSAIEWIGMIPNHWEVKRLIKEVDYINLPKAPEGTTDYLEIGDVNIHNNTYDIKNKDKLSVENARLANKNTLLISTVRPNRGGITITKYKHPVSSAFCAINNPSKYWFYFIKTKGFLNEIIKLNMDTTYPTCKDVDIVKQIVCVPNKKEQEEIAKYLDENCSVIDKKKELINKKIELLKEYKQSLIYEAVTGKINIKDNMKIDLEKLKRLKGSFKKEEIEAIGLNFDELLKNKIIIFGSETEFGYVGKDNNLVNSIKNRFYILTELGKSLIKE